MIQKIFRLTFILCLLLSACSSPESRFEVTQKEGTIEAYQAFIDTYPDHVLAKQARTTLARLEWEAITGTNDLDTVADYVSRYPDGEFREAAANKLEDLEFALAVDAETVAALETHLEKYPDSHHRYELDERIVELAYTAARNENTLPIWLDFLSRHKDSKYAAEGLEAVLDASETGGSFTYRENLATDGGLMHAAPDGSIDSYPDNTTLTITITDNDTGATYSANGRYVTMIDAYALFEVEEGQFYVRLPSGFLTPCFCGTLLGHQDNVTAEQQIYQRWYLDRMQSMTVFVRENMDSDDPEIISILGALQIPHAKRELDRLGTVGTERVQSLARQSEQVWQKIRDRACSVGTGAAL